MYAALVSAAQKFTGQRFVNGSGFVDKEFEAALTTVGYQPGDPWCAHFVLLCLRQAGFPGKELLDTIVTRQEYEFLEMGLETTRVPVPGSIAIWRFPYKNQGHCGIVAAAEGSQFVSVEGNVSRGTFTEVAQVNRSAALPYRETGMNFKFFILPYGKVSNL